MAEAVTQPSPRKQKTTRQRQPQIGRERRPIEADAYYSIRDLTDRQSPYYVASDSTIFRALRAGKLRANYLGRAVRIKGAAIHAWLSGREEVPA